MLSFEEYKKSLGDEVDDLTDDEIERVRKIQHELADIFFFLCSEEWANKAKSRQIQEMVGINNVMNKEYETQCN